MSQIFINTDKITDIEELEVVLVKNEQTAKKLRNEIKKLKQVKPTSGCIQINDPIMRLSRQLEQDETDNNEYLYYYEEIKNADIDITDDNLKQVIRDNLPSKENINYFKIISRIKAEIYKELIEFTEISKDEKDLDFLKEIKKYINFSTKKLQLINIVEQEKIISNEVKLENNIIFLKTNSGNIYAFSDLENIDYEYYDSFKELYDSIKNGTFKNVKRFKSINQKNRTLCEVKAFRTRIIFERLNANTYMILQLLVKKCDNDRLYRETLYKRYSVYKNIEDTIIEQLNDSEFLNENKELSIEFEKMLSKNSKKKG